MADYMSTADQITQDEISACAHMADRLLALGERALALGMIDALYAMLGESEALSAMPGGGSPKAKLTPSGSNPVCA